MSDQPLDSELSLRGIIGVGVVLIAVTAVVTALMWFMSVELRSHVVADDPTPSPLPEARVQERPSGPLLQADPIGELQQMRAEEAAVLEHSQWLDQGAGSARLAIETAIEIVGESGQLPDLGGQATASAEGAP